MIDKVIIDELKADRDAAMTLAKAEVERSRKKLSQLADESFARKDLRQHRIFCAAANMLAGVWSELR